MVCPVGAQMNVYAPVPPEGVMLMLPVQVFWQAVAVTTDTAETGEGSVTATVFVIEQLLASEMV